MRKAIIACVVIGLFTAWEFTYCIIRDANAKQKPVEVQYFKQGDTLLPDYACSDTLIVTDAAGLNKAIEEALKLIP